MSIEISVESLLEAGTSLPAKRFDKAVVSIGRNATNDIVLAQPDISGTHAILTLGAGKFVVRDTGSSNGTYIEGIKLEPNVETPLADGQRIIIGHFILLPKLFSPAVASEVQSSTQEMAAPKLPGTKAKSQQEVAAKPPAKPSPSAAVSHAAVKAPEIKAVPDIKSAPASGRPKMREDELEIKRTIHDQLIERLDLRRKDIVALSDEDLRARARTVVEGVLVDLRWKIPEGLDREKLIKEILDEALGLGPLEALLADDTISEIMVNSYDMIYAETKGKLALTEYRFSGESAVLAAVERIIAPIGRRIDESSPLVDARLKDGSRVNAVIRPLALNGPCITIRKFSKVPMTIDDLVRFNSLSSGMATFLKMAVEHRLNAVISGGTGSGKTTLLNIIASFIPAGERVITVEDAAELRLPQEHVISFETRPPNLEGKGAITIRDLVKNALRMRPDRIVVGECRGSEALDMLQAMNTGHDGSMTTGHANSPEDMVRRLETMVLTSGLDLPIRAVREQIASAVDIVIQQTRFGCGTRKVTAVSEVVGMDYDEGTVRLQDVFVFRQSGYGADGKIQGVHQATGYIPHFFRSLQERGLPVDASVFTPGN